MCVGEFFNATFTTQRESGKCDHHVDVILKGQKVIFNLILWTSPVIHWGWKKNKPCWLYQSVKIYHSDLTPPSCCKAIKLKLSSHTESLPSVCNSKFRCVVFFHCLSVHGALHLSCDNPGCPNLVIWIFPIVWRSKYFWDYQPSSLNE